MIKIGRRVLHRTGGLTIMAAFLWASALSAQTVTTLHSFTGSDGYWPAAGLVADASGNLYGTTFWGGASNHGTVFEVTPSGVATMLHSFNGSDGSLPDSALIIDAAGNLYGTTEQGGAFSNCTNGCGTVFELTPSGVETVLHSFNGSDGAYPFAGMIADASGNLYGTTYEMGAYGAGSVFQLSPSGIETVLHSFRLGGGDGGGSGAALIIDGSGNLYGTTLYGGSNNLGTVFELTPSGVETVLHSFGSGTDGSFPDAALITDASGNLYGTTAYSGEYGKGAVFKLTPSGTETILYAFSGIDGANPFAGLIADASGNLYGTTFSGGTSGEGTVFKLSPSGTETVLYSFAGSDGANPAGGLIADASGNLYGTTRGGGASNLGTVFELTGSGFVPPKRFSGTPGTPNCAGGSISALTHAYGGTAHAASALGYATVTDLQNAVGAYCGA